MHSLNTIQKLNAESFAPAIENLRRQGRDVVATYAGLALLSIESFSIRDEAIAALQAPTESPDEHRKLFVGHPGGEEQTKWPPLDAGEQAVGNGAQGAIQGAYSPQAPFTGSVIHFSSLDEALGHLFGLDKR